MKNEDGFFYVKLDYSKPNANGVLYDFSTIDFDKLKKRIADGNAPKIELGNPKVNKIPDLANFICFNEDNVCGEITTIENHGDKNPVIKLGFKPAGPKQQILLDTLGASVANFGIRALGHTKEDGTFKLESIITWDLISK